MQSVDFKLKPSKQYLMLLLIILCLSFVVILSLQIAIDLRLLLAMVTGWYVAYIIYRYVLLRGNQVITAIHFRDNGSWRVQTAQDIYEAKLSGQSTVTGVVSLLQFHVPELNKTLSSVVFRDALSKSNYRKLRFCVNL